MFKNKFSLVILFCFACFNSYCQQEFVDPPTSKVNIGIGIGLEYGGIGARLTVNPIPAIGLFAAGGYALAGPGYNLGMTGYLTPTARISPTISAMYGYNAAIKINGASQYDKVYYGMSLGFGIRAKARWKKNNFFNASLIVPFRSEEFKSDFDTLNNDPDISGLTKPWPVLIAVGYHFGI